MKTIKAITMGLFLSVVSSDAVASTPNINRFLPSRTFIGEILKKPGFHQQQIVCLALNVYYEGRGTDSREQMMIAKVTMNRVKTVGWPKTACGVVFQSAVVRGQRIGQFSWTTGNRAALEEDAWIRAQRIAYLAYVDRDRHDMTNNATYFHLKSIRRPDWSRKMNVVQTGNTKHMFLVDRSRTATARV